MRPLLALAGVVLLNACAQTETPKPTTFHLNDHARYLVNTLLHEPHQLLTYTHAPRCQENTCLLKGIDSAHHDLTRLLFQGNQHQPQDWQLHTEKLDYADLNRAKALIYANHPNFKNTNAIRVNLIYTDDRWKLDLSDYIASLQPSEEPTPKP